MQQESDTNGGASFTGTPSDGWTATISESPRTCLPVNRVDGPIDKARCRSVGGVDAVLL